MKIACPLTHHDASSLLEGLVYGSAREQAIKVLMAVDVQSRTDERERAAQLVEDASAAFACSSNEALRAVLPAIAENIRDPEAIPRERPGLLEKLQASIEEKA